MLLVLGTLKKYIHYRVHYCNRNTGGGRIVYVGGGSGLAGRLHQPVRPEAQRFPV